MNLLFGNKIKCSSISYILRYFGFQLDLKHTVRRYSLIDKRSLNKPGEVFSELKYAGLLF